MQVATEMKNQPVPFSVIGKMPTMHFFASPACNLQCPYCSQIDVRTSSTFHDAFADPSVLKKISRWQPTHFYLSGGEPFVHPGLPAFLKTAHRAGHIVSFDTNGVMPLHKLRDTLAQFPPDFWGFFNISHHLLAGIKLEYILERVLLCKDYKARCFVKYIAIPESIEEIKHSIAILSSEQVGWAISPFQTYKEAWNGRHFPQGYTREELIELLDLVTFGSHGFQFFGGINASELPCRGGTDFATYNMRGHCNLTPCCHRNDVLDFACTYWEQPSQRARKPCTHSGCLSDIMMILGMHGLADETETLERVCGGISRPLGLTGVIDFCARINSHAPLLNQNLYKQVLEKDTGTPSCFFQKPENLVTNAVLRQKETVASARERIKELAAVIEGRADLTLYQWGQLMALTLDFQPDLIIEIGRGKGSSTLLFTEAANRMPHIRTEVYSICLSQEFEKKIIPRCGEKIDKNWLEPLHLLYFTLNDFLLYHKLPAVKRVLLFWREAGFDTAKAMLGGILPKIQDQEHIMVFHGATDARYQGTQSSFTYPFWNPSQNSMQLQLGDIISNQPQLIPIYEFACRNSITLHSAEHDLRTGPLSEQTVRDQVVSLWGHDMMSMEAHWYWFSLNDKAGPWNYPEIEDSKQFNEPINSQYEHPIG